MRKYNITIVGCGNMGTVIMERLLSAGYVTKKTLTIVDNNPLTLAKLKKNGIKVENDLVKAVAKAEIIFLAVKPQQYQLIANDLKAKLRAGQIVISIMAGVTYKALARRLSHKNIVRTMPNLAAKIGKSISIWYTPEEFARKNKKTIENLLSVIGDSLQVKNEAMLDKTTAISGSGPAYFFYIAELLEQQACAFGFTAEEANKLVSKTFYGAAQLLDSDARSSAELRKAVSSKNGTTEAALKKLGPQFVKIWKSAIKAAYQRAKVISKEYE